MLDINEIGALIKILEKLVETDKIKKYIESKKSSNEFSKYVKSYEFCICFCLNQIITVIRYNQEFLDSKENELFFRAYESEIPRTKFPTETELYIFANNIFGLMDLIFKAKNYDELVKVVPNVNKYIITPFKEIIYDNFELKNKYKDLNKDHILLNLSRSYFHLNFHDVSKIRVGYYDIVKKGREFRAELNELRDLFENPFTKELTNEEISSAVEIDLEEDNFFDLFNNTSVNRAGNMREILGGQLFFEGYKLIIDYMWNNLFRNPFSKYEFLNKISLTKDWVEFDYYFEKIRDEIIIPLENRNEAIDSSFKRIFIKQNEILNETLNILKEKILFSVKREDLTKNEELDQLFLWYEVKLVNTHISIPCAYEFILALSGTMNFNDKELIKIIRFVHQVYEDDNNFSYAILIKNPRYEYAIWYIFFNFATNHSGTGGRAWRMVEEFIDKYNSRIDLSEYKIDSEKFNEYIKDREIKVLSKKIRELEDYKADAKGIISELVNTYIFSRLGYQIYWSLKENCTNYTEIDLLAFKRFKKMIIFYVIEITTTEQNLYEEVKHKIKILKKNSTNLLKFLKLEEFLNVKFKGMVISNIKTNLKADRLIKVINFKDVIHNLKDIGIDKRRLSKIIEL